MRREVLSDEYILQADKRDRRLRHCQDLRQAHTQQAHDPPHGCSQCRPRSSRQEPQGQRQAGIGELLHRIRWQDRRRTVGGSGPVDELEQGERPHGDNIRGGEQLRRARLEDQRCGIQGCDRSGGGHLQAVPHHAALQRRPERRNADTALPVRGDCMPRAVPQRQASGRLRGA